MRDFTQLHCNGLNLITPPAQASDSADNRQAITVADGCCTETSPLNNATQCCHHRPVVQHVVDGDLTIYSASAQKSRLLPVFRTPYSIVELDLSQVTDIDTAGVQLLILGCKITVTVGGSLRLTNIGSQVASIVDLFNLRETFVRAQDHCPICADDRIRNRS
jgi:anti-anti-sigma factor